MGAGNAGGVWPAHPEERVSEARVIFWVTWTLRKGAAVVNKGRLFEHRSEGAAFLCIEQNLNCESKQSQNSFCPIPNFLSAKCRF
jgi:hypothetical protein